MSTESSNLRRRGGYEVWYLTWNHAATGQGFWLRHVVERTAPPFGGAVGRGQAPASGPGHSELWFARFDPRDPARTFGVHRRFAGEPRDGAALPFSLAIGDARLAHDSARGSLTAAGHTVQWDLAWMPAARAVRQLPDVMYARGGLADTTVLSPNPQVAVRGTLVVDGERLELAGELLGQTHLWGKKHAFAWTWAHLADAECVLELLGVRLQRRGITLPTMTLVSGELGGERLRCNQLRHVARNRSRWELGRVAFEARSSTLRITGDLTCRPEHLIEAPYVDPDGTRVYCANTEIGDAHVTIERRTLRGWRVAHELAARGTAHFEIGGRERFAGVARAHVLVE